MSNVSSIIDLPFYDELFKRLIVAQQKQKPVLITGIRNAGKTTFMKKFLQSRKGLFIDAEKLYGDSEGNIPVNALERALRSQPVFGTLESSDDLGDDTCIWIAIDEVQFLRYYGHIGGKDLVQKFYSNLTNRKDLGFIFSSSERGLAESFLRISDGLERRNTFELMDIPRLLPEEATRFLNELLDRGAQRIGEVDAAESASLAEGVVGWLSVTAELAVKLHGEDRQILKNAFVEQAKLATFRELKRLSANSERYTTLMILIANGKNNWSSLKKAVHLSGDLISDTRLGALINTLNKSGFVEFRYTGKKKSYAIADPVIEFTLKKLLL